MKLMNAKRRFGAAHRVLLVLLSAAVFVGVASPAYASYGGDTAAPTVTIDPALHFTKGAPYDSYGDGDTSYLVSAKWHVSDASKICAVSGSVTAYYGDEEFFASDATRRSYSFEYSGYAQQRTTVNVSVTDCAGNTTTRTRVVTAGKLIDDPAGAYTDTWKNGTCYTPGCWMDGTIRKTWKAGATAKFTATGNAFALITDNRGTFDVYFDGKLVSHVVAGQSTVRNGDLSWKTYKPTRASHTIKVVARSGRVDVDGILVS